MLTFLGWRRGTAQKLVGPSERGKKRLKPCAAGKERSGEHRYVCVAAASLGLLTELAESGIRRARVDCERPAVRGTSVESTGRRGTKHVGLESERLESRTGKFGFHLALHGTPDNRAQRTVMGSA